MMYPRACQREDERNDANDDRQTPAGDFAQRGDAFPLIQSQCVAQMVRAQIEQQDLERDRSKSNRKDGKEMRAPATTVVSEIDCPTACIA